MLYILPKIRGVTFIFCFMLPLFIAGLYYIKVSEPITH